MTHSADYHAPAAEDPYSTEAIRAALTTTLLGRRLELHQQVASTNDLAREASRRGEPEGLVVLAEEQVAGRGRMGRAWTAPPDCCILCSVLLRPRFPAEHAFHLTMAASLAIYRALRPTLEGTPHPQNSALSTQHSALSTQSSVLRIKWPNDVLLNGRKVSGVLCESEWSGGEWTSAVVGFGINVNLDPRVLGELRGAATSLSAEMGREVDRIALLARVLAELESLYFLLQNGQSGVVHSEWAGTLDTLGKRVTVAQPDGAVEGVALRVDWDGALVLATAGGVERRVVAGDVAAL